MIKSIKTQLVLNNICNAIFGEYPYLDYRHENEWNILLEDKELCYDGKRLTSHYRKASLKNEVIAVHWSKVDEKLDKPYTDYIYNDVDGDFHYITQLTKQFLNLLHADIKDVVALTKESLINKNNDVDDDNTSFYYCNGETLSVQLNCSKYEIEHIDDGVVMADLDKDIIIDTIELCFEDICIFIIDDKELIKQNFDGSYILDWLYDTCLYSYQEYRNFVDDSRSRYAYF